jgi:4-hydroxy-tetrahydrodipicolinate reductase
VRRPAEGAKPPRTSSKARSAPGPQPLRLAVVGASGRMGRSVIRLAIERGDRVVCAIASSEVGRDAGELAGLGAIGVVIVEDGTAIARASADVIVDFSSPEATSALAATAAAAKVALVSGTTGLGAAASRALDRASKDVAVLWEPNMSVGVHVLAELVEAAVLKLGRSYDVEIVEVHHRLKVDAPSGTALKLAEVARAARGDGALFVNGREGRPGVRPAAQIGVHAVRGGDVVGDHVVHLLGAGERLELAHRASTRDLFAHGALRAARWIAGKPAGRYGMRDVLASCQNVP